MLFRPKKINKGFDRIFLMMAIIVGIFIGFYVGVEESNTVTENSIYSYLPQYPAWEKGETKEEYTKKEEAYKRIEAQLHENLKERKRQLEKQGYRVSFVDYYRKGHEWRSMATDNPNAPAIWIYPLTSSCIAYGGILAVISFLIAFFSFRGLALITLWIKQGFSEKE